MDKPPEVGFMVFARFKCFTYKLPVVWPLAISVPVIDVHLGVILLCS